jgi:hypothetical protein
MVKFNFRRCQVIGIQIEKGVHKALQVTLILNQAANSSLT